MPATTMVRRAHSLATDSIAGCSADSLAPSCRRRAQEQGRTWRWRQSVERIRSRADCLGFVPMGSEAAKKLNDTLRAGNPEGLHAIDNGQQGLAPTGDSDTLATRQRRFQVRGTCERAPR